MFTDVTVYQPNCKNANVLQTLKCS